MRLKDIFNKQTNSSAFREITEEMASIYEQKSQDYTGKHGSTALQMYDRVGIQYFVYMILQKALRMDALIGKECCNFESMNDTLIDCANYCIMAVLAEKGELE